MKSQWVRVADVVAIGPLMIWGACQIIDRYPVRSALLGLFGVGTVVYNARNWLAVREMEGRHAAQNPTRSLE